MLIFGQLGQDWREDPHVNIGVPSVKNHYVGDPQV